MRLNFEKIEEFTKINTEIIYQRKIKSCCKLNNNKKTPLNKITRQIY